MKVSQNYEAELWRERFYRAKELLETALEFYSIKAGNEEKIKSPTVWQEEIRRLFEDSEKWRR